MGPPQSSAEKWLQVLTSVLTNATMLPTFFLVLRRQRMDAAVVGLLTMSSSTIYHTLDTLGGTLLSMDAVQWHKLDNICAMINIIQIIVLFMQNAHPSVDQAFTWAYTLLILVCMEIGPWNPICTLIPIAVPLLVLFGKLTWQRRWADVNAVQVRVALGAMAAALVCFSFGLDDENDYLRLWHGMWHVFSGVFSYFSVLSNSKFDKRRMRLRSEVFGEVPWSATTPATLLAFVTGATQSKAS